MTGWLITNAFVHHPLFTEHFDALTTAAAAQGVTLSRKTNAELLLGFEKLPDFALFWDKDCSTLPEPLRSATINR
jgi:hypothetical protein